MSTFLLIPGAGGDVWFWSKLVPQLEGLGHQAIAVELPAADESAGLAEYAKAALDALNGRGGDDLVVVGQSLGGFTAPQVAAEAGASSLVLLNAMTPKPGERAGDWWAASGYKEAHPAPLDDEHDFFHDLRPDVRAELDAQPEPQQSGRPMEDPWPLAAWPDVPTRFLAGEDDRLFPIDFQRQVVAERLHGVHVEPVVGGHLLALSQPRALAAALLS